MYFILQFFLIVVILTIVKGSFVNPYPRYKFYGDDGDPGEPLFLSKYIENGDIETVSTCFRLLNLLLSYFTFEGDNWQLKNKTCIGQN